jgi:hypothetical protein
MSSDHTIPELGRKGLREFGLTTGIAIVVIFGLFFPWLLERPWPTWPWVIAAGLWFLALACQPCHDTARARHCLFRYDLADGDSHAPHGQGSHAKGARPQTDELPGSKQKEPEGKIGETLLMLDFLADLWAFMRERKKFWLAPIILVMILLGALIVFAQGSSLAPFIYTLF